MMKLGMLMALADKARRSVTSPDADASWDLACLYAPCFPGLAASLARQCIATAQAA